MKYKSITLNNNHSNSYSLVKYDNTYKELLDDLNVTNDILKEKVMLYPTKFDIDSKLQSYMIMENETDLVGLISIEPSDNCLKVTIEFDKNFKDYDKVTKSIYYSLGLFFNEYKSIGIELIGHKDIELFKEKHIIKVSGKNNIHIFSNSFFNSLISKLVKEIKGTINNLAEWNCYWNEDLEMKSLEDFGIVDKELLLDIKEGNIPYEEIFNKVDSIHWSNITTKKSNRFISFNSNGEVSLTKTKKDSSYQEYEIIYNVLNKFFSFKKDNTLLEETEHDIYLETPNIDITRDKITGEKRVYYNTDIDNNCSMNFELFLDENDKVKKCNIDYRTHKNNGKINGIYTIRINPKEMMSKITYITRKGIKTDIAKINNDMYFYGMPTISDLEEIALSALEIINVRAQTEGKKTIDIDTNRLISKYSFIEADEVRKINELKGEIPLPHLIDIFDTFVERYYKKIDNKNILKKVLT